MTIRLYRGVGGERSPFISFVGLSSEGASSTSVINTRINIEAKLSGDLDRVDVVNRMATHTMGSDMLELFGVHYTDWRDFDDSTFTSAVGVVSAINNYAYAFNDGHNALQPTLAAGSYLVYTLNSGSPYTIKIEFDGSGRYYWDPTGLPPGMDISAYDNRIIEGTPTTPGLYYLDFDITNAFGSFPHTATITVV